jgi:hypothetical protein
MDELLNKWVTEAQPMNNYWLKLVFNDGNVKHFDCKPLIEQYPIFSPLKDTNVFRNISLDGWTVSWADGAIDIAPEYLYEHSIPTTKPYRFDDDSPLPTAAEEPSTSRL